MEIFIVKIDSLTSTSKCSEISEISVSNFNTGEWVIFPVSNGKAEVALRIRNESLNASVINFIFSSNKASDAFLNENNSIKIYLADI